jgi:hypothetical protein
MKSSTCRFSSAPAGPGWNPPGVVGDWSKPTPLVVTLTKLKIVGMDPS